MGSRARHGANRLRRLTRTRLICWDTEGFLHPIHAVRLTTTPTMAYVYLYEGTAVVVFFRAFYCTSHSPRASHPQGLFFLAHASTFSCLIGFHFSSGIKLMWTL